MSCTLFHAVKLAVTSAYVYRLLHDTLQKRAELELFQTNLCKSELDAPAPYVPAHKYHAFCFHFLAVIPVSALQSPISELECHLQISDPHLTC
jgi:hypothetical protein